MQHIAPLLKPGVLLVDARPRMTMNLDIPGIVAGPPGPLGAKILERSPHMYPAIVPTCL